MSAGRLSCGGRAGGRADGRTDGRAVGRAVGRRRADGRAGGRKVRRLELSVLFHVSGRTLRPIWIIQR